MKTCIFTLLSLCLVFSALGIPIGVKISPPKINPHHRNLPREDVNPQLLDGGFEGDMILPEGFNPKSRTRGVARFGDIKWPNGVIPYDMSAITDVNDQKMITEAMDMVMYSVGTPMPDTDKRQACISFRPRESTDTQFFTIHYGDVCSSHTRI